MGGVRTQDRRHLWVAFFTLGSIMAAHAIGETARDALFLTGLSPTALPWAYMTIAGLALVVVRVNDRVLRWAKDKRKLMASTMVLAAGVDAWFWTWLGGDVPQGRAFVLYVWTGLFATVSVVQFWLLLGDVVDVSQAKRIFGPAAAGGVLGATLGAFVAERILDAGFEARHLMFAAAGALALGAAFPMLWKKSELASSEPEEALPTTVTYGLMTLCSHVYLRRLLMLVMVSTIALTGADYVFKSVVAEYFTTAESLGQFFARFYVGLNIIALMVQLLLSGWLLRLFGVNRTLLVLPSLVLLSAIGFLVVPGLLAVVVMKGADGSLRHSLNRTATEVLYLPLPRELRDRFKGLIDGVGQRGGQALASLGILGLVYAGAGVWIIAAAVTGLAALWLVVLVGLKNPYLALFKQSLRGGSVGFDSALVDLDLHSLEALISTLNSERDEEVLVALELFERYERINLIPKLILYHPSTAVALRALELFINAGDASFVPIAHRLMRTSDPDLRAGALRAISAISPDEELLVSLLDDDCAALGATALVGMLAAGLGEREMLLERLERTVKKGSLITKAQLARAITRQPDPVFVDTLNTLIKERDEPLRLEVLSAMGEIADESFIPRVIAMLDVGALRPAARSALQQIGEPALHALAAAFEEPGLSRRVRRHLPRTIHRFGSAAALEILQRRLVEERDGAVRYKILRGLGRLMENQPSLPLDRKVIRSFVDRHLERIVRLMHYRGTLLEGLDKDESRSTTGSDLLVACIREKEINALERLFRLNHLLNPQESFQLYWKGLTSDSARARAASRELLDHAMSGRVRDVVLAVTDDVPMAERCARAASALNITLDRYDYAQCLGAMVEDASETIRSLAAYHVAELGLTDLAPRLRRHEARPGSAVGEVFSRALEVLSGARPGVPGVA